MAGGWYMSDTIRPDSDVSACCSNGPFSPTTNMSMAVMRPSRAKPTFVRPCKAGRAPPMKCSSSLLIRIITGALAFFDRRAGIMTLMLPVALLPKPPPVYSAMSTMSLDSMCIHRAIASSVWTVLWVPECRYSLPFCQYAIADRDSSV